ncbi:MAG: hypothetical protein Q7K47_02355 [Fusobacterium sp. JB019]|nr:hypothetical protein [Fusobacterium sp. JB019]
MTNFNLTLNIYDYSKYLNVLKNYSCNFDYYPSNPTQKANSFIKDLLNLSNNRCYICGHNLESNHSNGIYFEKEHLINKTIENKINPILKRCKKNIVPICKICNSQKITVHMSPQLKKQLITLNDLCKKNDKDNFFEECFEIFKNENFDFRNSSNNNLLKKIQFNFLLKTFYGDYRYINQFDFNSRTKNIFNDIIKLTYNMTFNFNNNLELKNHILMFSKSAIEDDFIEWLFNKKIITNNCNPKKINNLLETMTLLEYIY